MISTRRVFQLLEPCFNCRHCLGVTKLRKPREVIIILDCAIKPCLDRLKDSMMMLSDWSWTSSETLALGRLCFNLSGKSQWDASEAGQSLSDAQVVGSIFSFMF